MLDGKRFGILGRMVLTGLWFWVVLVGCARRDPDPPGLDMLPGGVLEVFTLAQEERPAGMVLATDPEILERAGLSLNPGYTVRKREREAMAKVGGVVSWVGLYKREGEVRLVLNGIFFADETEAGVFRGVQESRDRPVAGFRRELDSGEWLVFAALDPELEYSGEEMEWIRAGLDRYASRLDMETLFDHLQGPP